LLLAKRTACGIAFDRLTAEERVVRREVELGTLAVRWQGHHRAHTDLPRWCVQWSSGPHRVALALRPGPGAWAFAQSFFDRASPALSWALVAGAFEPWWAADPNAPWAASAASDGPWLGGGVDAQASIGSRNLSFEFELVFASAGAAHAVAAAGRHGWSPWAGGTAEQVPLRCEVFLGRLHAKRGRLAALRPGDLLLAPVCQGGAADGRSSSCAVAPSVAGAVLHIGQGRYATARVVRDADHRWRITEPLRFPLAGDHTMDAEDPVALQPETPSSSDPAQAWQDLPVGVDLVAGRLTMRLAQLQALRPGDVLDFDESIDEARIEVRIAGRPWAHGTLVALDGRLAVQLAEVGSAPRLGSAFN
jgi:type III secretion system YscQ/HrcQ family protein